MSKFLVTGGCGFIGSHLVEYLLEIGAYVTIIDNLSTGYRANIPCDDKRIEFVEANIEDLDLMSFNDEFDGVFHLAAQASVPLSIQNFYDSSSTNLLSTIKIIEYCSKYTTPLIYASSSAVYGNQPLGDESGSVDLLSPYSVDKYLAELYCGVAFKINGLKSYGLRFFNVYGPRQDPKNPYSGVISIFSDRILKKQAITINGGYQTRDFVYVKDVVRGLWVSYQFLIKNSVATYSNLLTGKSVSIDELADIIIKITGNNVEKKRASLPAGDPEVSLGKIDKMNTQLCLNNFVALEEGLRNVLEWMSKCHD